MAYSIQDLINTYNSGQAQMLNQALLTQNGFLEVATSYFANKQMAHSYYITNTVPAGQVRTLNTGVAFNNTTGSIATMNLTSFTNPTAIDRDITGDLTKQLTSAALRQMVGLGTTLQKCMIYGTDTNFGGIASYTGNSLHDVASSSALRTTLSGSNGTGSGMTSIFCVRFAPMEDVDGAAIVVHPFDTGAVIAMNDDFGQLMRIPDASGYLYPGYIVDPNIRAALLVPGTKCVASIVGINTVQPTAEQIDTMIDSVLADGNTYIFANRRGKRILNKIGKVASIQTMNGQLAYNRVSTSWNGIPIVLDQNISDVETAACYNF